MWPFSRSGEQDRCRPVDPHLEKLKQLVDHYYEFGGITKAAVYEIVDELLQLGASYRDILTGLSLSDSTLEVPEKESIHGTDIHAIIKWPDRSSEDFRKAAFAIRRWFDELRPAHFEPSPKLVSSSFDYNATLEHVMVQGGLDEPETYRQRVEDGEFSLFGPSPEDLDDWLQEANRALQEIGPLLFDEWERTASDPVVSNVRRKLGV